MVQHIVSWNYADGFSDDENRTNAQKVKYELEALGPVIDGIIELKVYTDILPSGNKDIVLYSLFESVDCLNNYQVHPEHKRVSAYVGTVMKNRSCIDFVI